MKNTNCCLAQLYRVFFCLMVITALAVSVSNAQCPADYPVDCGNGYCCPITHPYCDDSGNCFAEPRATTTTTTPGSAETGTYIAAINVTGTGRQDAPQPSGTLPGTSPLEAGPLMTYEGIGRPIPLSIKDRLFPPLDKKLYETTLASLKELELSAGPQIATYALGDVRQFWVKDEKDFAWRQVSATSKREGAHSIIYVDNTLNMAEADLDTYVAEFELMYTIVLSNIGNSSDRDANNKIIIFIYNVNDNASVQTGWLAGYFWSKDYLSDADAQKQGVRSNAADMIYIRGDEPSGWDDQQYGSFAATTLTTLIHEYQHMAHFCITYWQPRLAGKNGDFDDTWINEMMSMAAETMYFKKKLADNPSYTHDGMLPGGFLEDRIRYYNKDPKNSIRNGHGLVYWDNSGDVYSNYSLAYIFGQYLNLQSSSGQGIYKEILNYMTANSVYDYRAVEGVAKQRLPGIGSWEDLIRSWAIANMLNQASGLYGYRGAFSLTPHGPTSANVTMHSGGVVYRIINGSWIKPADAGAGIMYCVFNSSGEVTCEPTSGSTTTIPGNNCPPEYPVDCNNGYCCPGNLPVCGTGNNEGKCLTKGICVSSLMFGKDSYENELLRSFRDQVLARNSRGEELSRLYYEHTGELAAIILGDRDLYKEVLDVALQLIPALESTLQGSVLSIDSDAGNIIDVICVKIAQKARPDLRKAVEKMREDLRACRLQRELGLTQ